MSLFINFLAFEDQARQDLAKVGILFSSFITVAYVSVLVKLDIRSAVVKGKMSPKVYSNDIKEKVIEDLLQGQTYHDVAQKFNVSVSAIGRWYRKYKKAAAVPQNHRSSKIKIDLNALEEYVRLNPKMKLEEAAIYFGFSKWTIRHWLTQLGYCYKRKPTPTWKYSPRNLKATTVNKV